MTVIIYGDFNCPYSYLASQRADLISHLGAVAADWRAVEHDRALPLTGSRSDDDRATWDLELAEAASLALPDEDFPAAPPALISNTQAAVAAYAEAVSDGIAGELRRRLFCAIWMQGRHLSSAYEVRPIIARLMWPAEDISARLASPDLPGPLLHDPDLARIVRRSGGTITPDGGPLTGDGWRLIRRWRQEWLALPSQVIPAVVGEDGLVRSGTEGLRYLADLASSANVVTHPRGGAVPARGASVQPGLATSASAQH